MGALKAALTAIFNANNYTSATSGIASKKIPVNESNGLPSGQIGMSDLASVLGASYGKWEPSSTNFDTIDTFGIYFVQNGTNGPLETDNTGVLVVVRTAPGINGGIRKIQTFYGVNDKGAFFRIDNGTKAGSPSVWQPWIRLSNL